MFFHCQITSLRGVTFTLNLGPEVETVARADKRGFTVHVRRRLERALRKTIGPNTQFWFSVDITPEGRAHLHGGIGVPVQREEELTAALQHAGGAWASRAGSEHQVHIGVAYDEGWAFYSTRNITTPKRWSLTHKDRKRPDPMISVTDRILKNARVFYAAERAIAKSYRLH